jgi:hypothetical protein
MAELVRDTENSSLLWGAFQDLREGLERFVALSLVWSVQLLPAVAALAIPTMSLLLRMLFAAYSLIAIVPITAVLHDLAAKAVDGEDLTFDKAKESFQRLLRPSLTHLAPAFVVTILLSWAITLTASHLSLGVFLRVLLLLWLLVFVHWGPVFIAQGSSTSPFQLFIHALSLVRNHPVQSLGVLLLLALLWILGMISIGGVFLVVPALSALVQARFASKLNEVHS